MVIVPGGAGFLGSYLVEQLVEDGATVTVADNLSRGTLANLRSVKDRIIFIQTDLRLLNNCEEVCKGQDIVMNLAAPVFGVEYSCRHHGEMLTDTVLIAFNLLEAAGRCGAERTLVVSSSCVYPDDALVPTPETEGRRNTPESSNAGYGWGKRMAELQAQYYAAEYGMKITIARPFNAYGSREPVEKEKAHVIPAIIRKVLSGEDPVVIWGSGNQTRSFMHGSDVASALKLLVEHYPIADPVNIGSGQEITVRELAERIVKQSGKNVQIVYDTTKPEGATRKASDVHKMMTVLKNFQQKVSLDQGLSEMIQAFRAKMLQ